MLGFMNRGFASLPMADAMEALADDPSVVLIDVRTPEEYRQGHIPGSASLPLNQADELESVVADKDAKIFAYCLSGARSRAACRAFAAMGYRNVTDIGGIANYAGPIAR